MIAIFWAGIVCAISFLEAWIKVRAQPFPKSLVRPLSADTAL